MHLSGSVRVSSNEVLGEVEGRADRLSSNWSGRFTNFLFIRPRSRGGLRALVAILGFCGSAKNLEMGLDHRAAAQR